MSKIKIYIMGKQKDETYFQLKDQTPNAIQSPFDNEHCHMRRTHQCVIHPKLLLRYCLAAARVSECHSVFVCPAVTQCAGLDVCVCARARVSECEAHTHTRTGFLNQD